MATGDPAEDQFTYGASELISAAHEELRFGNHEQLCINHWLFVLLVKYGPMAESLTRDLEHETLKGYIREKLKKGDTGETVDEETLKDKALELAKARGSEKASERDLASAILLAAGYDLVEATPEEESHFSGATLTDDKASLESGKNTYLPKAKRPTPTLDRYGRDLTRAAREDKLGPVVGRDREIDAMALTLCRRTKRNPALIGPAGVGKTAIVEGLAQRIAAGKVSDALKGMRIIALQPSVLIAGASLAGEMEKRIKELISEAKQEGIILFIDEAHTIVGAGGRPGAGDMSNMLKPALARGDIACIAATTDDEYRRFIRPDSALERRFNPIKVQELNEKQTLVILKALRDDTVKKNSISVSNDTLEWLLNSSKQYLTNRYFPDKAIDLFDQIVAFAISNGKNEIGQDDARNVVEDMVGVPVELEYKLGPLQHEIEDRALMNAEDTESLIKFLQVTERGLDMRNVRPNAVVALCGRVQENSKALSEVIAETLFGDTGRVVEIDCGRFLHPSDLNFLLGSAPGYVDHDEKLLIHEIEQTPWCVVCFDNMHVCHPVIRDVISQAISNGFFTDSNGKRIFLSESIVLICSDITLESDREAVGFATGQEKERGTKPARESLEKALGEPFVSQCDLVYSECVASDEDRRGWIERTLLEDLSERYRKLGVNISWDNKLLDWLGKKQAEISSQRDWERFVDKNLTPLLIPLMSDSRSEEVSIEIVLGDDGNVRIK